MEASGSGPSGRSPQYRPCGTSETSGPPVSGLAFLLSWDHEFCRCDIFHTKLNCMYDMIRLTDYIVDRYITGQVESVRDRRDLISVRYRFYIIGAAELVSIYYTGPMVFV